MSHFSTYKTQLRNVSVQLLQQAIKGFAQSINATLATSVQDFYGNKNNVGAGLVTQGLPNGIGFDIDAQGNLEVKGDSYGHEAEWQRVSNLAQNYIKAFKVAQTARNTHPTARMNMKVLRKQVILEVNI